jgi:hypothetical protein
MKFSQRIGITPAIKVAQKESMDEDLRNGLWSLLCSYYWQENANSSLSQVPSHLDDLIYELWFTYFKYPIDKIDITWMSDLREYYFNATWYQIYDFIEFIANHGSPEIKNSFIRFCNTQLETENSAYRFIGDSIAEITSTEEIEEIEQAIIASTPYAGVKEHLKSALSLMSNKTNPDYRNSIKESISSVESLAKQISQNNTATLGVVLKELEKSKKLHPALKSAFSSLYGYTNDAEGIRHALLEESNLTKADARFMLVCCSAFVNYAIEAISL